MNCLKIPIANRMQTMASVVRFLFWIGLLAQVGCGLDITVEDLQISSSSEVSWDFTNPDDYSFDSSFLSIENGQARLQPVTQSFSADAFREGNHFGTTVTDNQLALQVGYDSESGDAQSILPLQASDLIGYWRFDGNLLD